ncbi:MAG: hypothetical protein AUF68_06505 [Verrucomicrobia bacterium 13_1_20CM_54_28]|nr:MAG: hypothetical protein AUI00_04140 [Verrucomicrobia bacterium 13_2_20CM_2_54_15]OLD72565.1 MAG: hypothetical protein AUF68_06505 [Verrucomicrobia bacterium 13_1_20CM_54_28]OLD90522.1 MAG: hypothetical protein AUG81_02360 [Verrucomicrobia bacterium 13_1_20CM_4_54_11]
MRRAATFILLVFACHQLRALPEHSVSPSRQFVIYGAAATLRGAISELAEQTKTNLLALLRQRDGWKTAIVINLQTQQANLPEIPPASLRVSQTGFGVKLQLDLTVGQNFDGSLVERQLLRAILFEMIYRDDGELAPGARLVEPPDWLLEGALALTPGREREALVEALSTADKGKSLQEFLGQRFDLLDSAGRMLYRAYSVALVQLLLDEGGGRGRLARYISNLSHGSNDRVADLKACFPQLRDDVEKKWRSRVARLSEHQTYQLLSFAESEQRLDELIQIKISDGSRNRGRPKPANLSELSRSKLSAEGKAAVNHMSQGLLLLVGTAHPVLRPVAREYQQIAALLIRGKRRGIAKRVSHLDGIRKELAARMGDIDDYMNWFEATQMENQSGAFSDYLKAANQSQVSAQRRRDPLSVYLDALEDQIETSELE